MPGPRLDPHQFKALMATPSTHCNAHSPKHHRTPHGSVCAPRAAASQTSALGAHLSLQASPPKTAGVESWLASYHPPTPPPDAGQQPQDTLKRKRAMSLPAPSPTNPRRSGSPKRPRVDDTDDIRPGQSASEVGSTRLALNARNTFSPTPSQVSSSPKRSLSPTRETTMILRNALPPVVTESLNGLKEAPPTHVEELGDRLAKGVDTAFIPQGLQARTFGSSSHVVLTNT
jgi:hypothetical protein